MTNVKTPRQRKSYPARHPPLEPAQLDAVAELFSVLSEPTRLRILRRLQSGPASVGELVEELMIKQANASKQLGILMSAGVVARRQQGNHAIFSIALPLVLELCQLVCRGVADHAAERAAALEYRDGR